MGLLGRPSLDVATTLGSQAARDVAYQVVTAIAIAATLYLLATTAADNIARHGIASGFRFLEQQAGYDVAQSFIPHTARDTFARTIVVGLFNTIFVSVIGIVLATIFGVILGVARVSSNWLVARFSSAYIEFFRNTPLLVQIVFWNTVMSLLPSPREGPLQPVASVFLSNRGLHVPWPVWDAAHGWALGAFPVGVALGILYGRWARRHRDSTGRVVPVAWPAIGIAIALPLGVWLVSGAPLTLEMPVPGRFNIRGGIELGTGFISLLLGLVAYFAAFIGEIVRAGIQAVGVGQREAARSLGIREGQIMRHVVLPQALRVIVPPLTSQHLSLVKDSSLGIWTGYSELTNVTNSAVNQTGQALECIFILMSVYLSLSLSISAFMNWYNRKVGLRG